MAEIRWAVGPLMLSIAILGATAPSAKAGQWEITYEGNGQLTQDGTTSAWLIIPSPGVPPMTQGGGGGQQGGRASTSGSITLVCKWTPTSNGEIIPKAVFVPTHALASVHYSGDRPSDLQGQVNSGAKTVSESSFVGGDNVTEEWVSNNRILFPLAGGGQASDGSSKTWRFTVNLSASFSGSGSPMSGGVSVEAKAPVEDDRSVTLSRAGAINEWNENGDKHGDTVYSSFWCAVPDCGETLYVCWWHAHGGSHRDANGIGKSYRILLILGFIG